MDENSRIDRGTPLQRKRRIKKLARKFRISDKLMEVPREIEDGNEIRMLNSNMLYVDSVGSQWSEIHHKPPDWHSVGQQIVLQHKANNVDLPLLQYVVYVGGSDSRISLYFK